MIDQIRLDAHLANGKVEYVMCAANYVDDGIDYTFKPFNIDKGRTFSGHRHSQCFESMHDLYPHDVWGSRTKQGFLTTKNRFLTRAEALELVISTGQLKQPLIGGVLTSEDLW